MIVTNGKISKTPKVLSVESKQLSDENFICLALNFEGTQNLILPYRADKNTFGPKWPKMTHKWPKCPTMLKW